MIAAFVGGLLLSSSALAGADSIADLDKYAAAMRGLHSYRTVTQAPMGRVISEFVTPDRYRVTMFNGLQFIVIGRNGWVKANGRWTHQRGDLRWITSNGPPVGDFRRDFKVTDLGMQGALHVYQLTREGKETTVLYLRSDFLPAKLEQTTDGQKMTITYSNFNEPIAIKQPI